MESISKEYVWGLDGEPYIIGPEVLNGRLLIHAQKKTRLFVIGSEYDVGSIKWESCREYPSQTQFYHMNGVLFTDIEADLCPIWKEKAERISQEEYENLCRSSGVPQF